MWTKATTDTLITCEQTSLWFSKPLVLLSFSSYYIYFTFVYDWNEVHIITLELKPPPPPLTSICEISLHCGKKELFKQCTSHLNQVYQLSCKNMRMATENERHKTTIRFFLLSFLFQLFSPILLVSLVLYFFFVISLSVNYQWKWRTSFN